MGRCCDGQNVFIERAVQQDAHMLNKSGSDEARLDNEMLRVYQNLRQTKETGDRSLELTSRVIILIKETAGVCRYRYKPARRA